MERQRLMRLQNLLAERKLSALVVFNRANVRYLTGFTGSAGVLLVPQQGRPLLITDGRYKLQAKEQTQEVKARIAITRETAKVLAKALPKGRWSQAGFEGRYCSVAFWESWQEQMKGSRIRLESVTGLVEQLRAVKDEQELQHIRIAAQLADAAVEHALKVVREGMTEKELAWEIESFLRSRGADALAFNPIVVFGERTALPHGQPSDRPLRKGDLITLDLGAMVNGYCSDITRTFVFGRPNAEQKRLHQAVWDALQRGVEAVRAKQKGSAVDRIVRQTLKEHQLDKFFLHGTGHGVGLEIHEQPALGKRSKDVLQPNMVVTVEPGVYLDRFGGVRLEEMVLVTEGDPELLTHAPNPPKLLSV